MMRTHTLLLLVLILMVPCFCCAKSDPYIKELRAMQKMPGDVTSALALHRQALAAYGKNDFAEAARLWHASAKSNPAWERPYFNLACVRSREGRASLAVEYLTIAMNMNPFLVLAWARGDRDLDPIKKSAEYQDLARRFAWEKAKATTVLPAAVRFEYDTGKGELLHLVFGNSSFYAVGQKDFGGERGSESYVSFGRWTMAGNTLTLRVDYSDDPGGIAGIIPLPVTLSYKGPVMVNRSDYISGEMLRYAVPGLAAKDVPAGVAFIFYGMGYDTSRDNEAFIARERKKYGK